MSRPGEARKAAQSAMGNDRYYLLATLPALGQLGSLPPVGLAELLEQVGDSLRAKRLLSARLLADDLVQREAFLAGEIAEVEPVVLSEEAARNQDRLPEYLAPAEQLETAVVPGDILWDTYFRYVADLGRRHRNSFLPRWVSFEVGLRNTLVGERARRLGLSAASYQVAADLVAVDLPVWEENFSDALKSWAAAATPLDGLRELIRFRWDWLEQHDPYFSFSEDELLVYAARLMLLEQWHRINEQATSSPDKTPEQSSRHEETAS